MIITLKRYWHKLILKNSFKIKTLNANLKIHTTLAHPLSVYLNRYPLYDRFIPNLSSVVNKTVIDIGANIGDTAALIKAIKDVDIICVEPDDKFIQILKRNIVQNSLKNITVYPYAISSKKRKVKIEKSISGGTGNLVESLDGEANTKTFQELLKEVKIDLAKVGLIKIDTDGYDWDCLNTISEYLVKSTLSVTPEFIFYEHQLFLNNKKIDEEDSTLRQKKYLDSINNLKSLGYSRYYIFDNYGSLIIVTNEIDVLEQITFYPISSLLKNNLTTYYYCDVLITKEGNDHLVRSAIRQTFSLKYKID